MRERQALLEQFETFGKLQNEFNDIKTLFEIGSEEIAAAVGPTKYFSKSFFGVSLMAIFVIRFFVILNKIPLSRNSFLKESSSVVE